MHPRWLTSLVLLFVLSLGTRRAEPQQLLPWPSEPFDLQPLRGAHTLVFPPAKRKSSSAPMIMMLHGMCAEPAPACAGWAGVGRRLGWLVCPAGNVRCHGARDWRGSGEVKARYLDAVVTSLRARVGGRLAAPGNDVLVGFSRGAFVARDVVYARPGRFRGLVLIGAAMVPDAARLKRSGIRRVVMMSGDYDGARGTMMRAAKVLSTAGLDTRFISAGPIYHQLPVDLDRLMRAALRWIAEEPQAASG